MMVFLKETCMLVQKKYISSSKSDLYFEKFTDCGGGGTAPLPALPLFFTIACIC